MIPPKTHNRGNLRTPAKEIPLELKLSAWEWEKLLWALLAINPLESKRAQMELDRRSGVE